MPPRFTLLRLMVLTCVPAAATLIGGRWGVVGIEVGIGLAVPTLIGVFWIIRAFPFQMLLQCPFCGAAVRNLRYKPKPEGMLIASDGCEHIYRVVGEWTPWRRDLGPPEPWGPFHGMAFVYDRSLTVVLLENEETEVERRRSPLPDWLIKFAAS